MKIKFVSKTFQEFSVQELYDVMVLRQAVFVVEQNCPYLDADGQDQIAHHLMGYLEDGSLVAYVRILPKGVIYEKYPAIGRVITAKAIRAKKQGYVLMQKAIELTEQLYPNQSIKLSAQSHLTKFYGKLGFVSTGQEYLEDGIPHTAMVRLIQ